MGAIVPQVITEDRAGGAQVIDGGLRFDSGKSHYLSRTPAAGNRKTWTFSCWVKRGTIGGSYQNILSAANSVSDRYEVYFDTSTNQLTGEIRIGGTGYIITTTQVFRDPSAWYHILVVMDTSQATASDRHKFYVNGTQVTNFASASYPNQDATPQWNAADPHSIGRYQNGAGQYFNGSISNVYLIDGQALDPSYFGYTDPLTNVWRPKKLSSSIAFGTNGFYLPFDGSAPIGQDQSGRGNNWTPVNFGGSNTIEKATGALPILNTDGGGKVARVGVRTDAYASSLVLALPLVGIKSDFSNAINSGTSNKAITANGNAAASSAQSNFYGGSFYLDGTGDYLITGSSTDFGMGTGDFTLEGWVYCTRTGNYQGIISDRSDGANGNSINILNTNKIEYQANGTNYTTTFDIPLNSWHHVALCRSSGTAYAFFNGVLLSSYSASGDSGTTETFAFGRYYYNSDNYYFQGYLQDFRVYKGLAKYTSNFIPASTDPDIVPDSPSGVSYSSNVALVPSTDGAVAFDGSGDYLNVGTSSDYAFGTGDFTMECFVYHNDLTGQQTYFSDAFGNTAGIYFCKREPANGNVLAIYTTTFIVTGSLALSSRRWYHIAVCRSSGTIRLFVDGVLDGSAADSTNLTQTQYSIGESFDGTSGGMNGFISNAHIVKGTALYTTNFTPPSAPISSVANTKLLCCKSNSSATAADVTPGTITANGNAAASNFNPFTVNINTQRGKQSGYCTWNPLNKSSQVTISNGNLNYSASGSNTNNGVLGTIAVSSGKWYWEYTCTSSTSGSNFAYLGIAGISALPSTLYGFNSTNYIYQETDGNKKNNDVSTAYGASWTTGDIIGVAFDADAGTLTFYKNNISQGVAFSSIPSNSYTPSVSSYASGTVSGLANFGQKPFKFPPPAGFQPLTLANTPRPTIVRPDQYVGVTTYSGQGTGAFSVSGIGFKPDFIWVKRRDTGEPHILFDSVRGVPNALSTSDGGGTGAEFTNEPIASIDRDGWSYGSGSSAALKTSGGSFVAWTWKAGGNSNTFNVNDVGYATASAAGLTAGTITPTGASVNTKSGFSIITYTGNGSQNATISHGLGVRPSLHILKNRTTTSNWVVLSQSIDGSLDYAYLNSTAAFGNAAQNAPTSSVFSVWDDTDSNANGNNYVAYLWAEIPGFSKFGSFSGNNSTDGTVVTVGFRPKFIIVKCTQDVAGDVEQWIIRDSTRSPYNPANANLYANLSNAEDDASGYSGSIDILSNGFKMRGTYGGINASATYIYACWAEAPTFNLYGAQANAR